MWILLEWLHLFTRFTLFSSVECLCDHGTQGQHANNYADTHIRIPWLEVNYLRKPSCTQVITEKSGLLLTTNSKVKLFAPSIFSVVDQGVDLRQVHKSKLEMDIEKATSWLDAPSIFSGYIEGIWRNSFMHLPTVYLVLITPMRHTHMYGWVSTL
jgi:hypothetical protein